MPMKPVSFSTLIRTLLFGGLAILVGLEIAQAVRGSDALNGFDLTGSLVPADEVHAGGPPRDGIPAIDRPRFLTVDQAAHVKAGERVLTLDLDGQARAYPISILNWHEIVNDRIGDRQITITYCPLCGTGMAFEAPDARGFGVSGLLYNSDMLLYDRATESLWSQIMATAISGPRKGDKLEPVPLLHTNWGHWRAQHRDSLILSRRTGFRRDYDLSPYLGYESSPQLYFPVSDQDARYHEKESVIGLALNGQHKVWPFSELAQANPPVADSLGGQALLVHYDPDQDHAWITDRQDKPLPAVRAYWFAWISVYPDSQVYQAD